MLALMPFAVVGMAWGWLPWTVAAGSDVTAARGQQIDHYVANLADGLRIAEKGVELLCAPGLHAPATAYARALNQAVWQERGEESLAERLEPFKAGFLAAARLSLA